MLAAVMRPDSATLLKPYVTDLETITKDPRSPLKNTVLYILGSTRPVMITDAASFLTEHLEDKANSPQETLTIALSLLEHSDSYSAMFSKVLTFVERQPDLTVKTGVLTQVGLWRKRDTVSLSFIGNALNNAATRRAAIDAVSRLDRNVRAQYVAQLNRIANDPESSSEIRSAAEAAMAL
jgi:hypothetical protein